MSAKELGQIHVSNFSNNVSSGDKVEYDLPGDLSNQLSRIIRAGQYFKVVGIDMTLDSPAGVPVASGTISGDIRYYAPTRGRCAAFRGAFRSAAELMKSQGIAMRDNKMYDFRVPLNNEIVPNVFKNNATLDGSTPLALNSSVDGASIFGVHNASVRPQYDGTAADLYAEGFDTVLQQGQGNGTDFVLNDTVPFSGDVDFASEDYETIPFVLTWEDGPGGFVQSLQWRPDPALYVAMLCGQLQVVINQFESDTTAMTLNTSIMTSGWKSIMGNPDAKKKSAKRSESHS